MGPTCQQDLVQRLVDLYMYIFKLQQQGTGTMYIM